MGAKACGLVGIKRLMGRRPCLANDNKYYTSCCFPSVLPCGYGTHWVYFEAIIARVKGHKEEAKLIKNLHCQVLNIYKYWY